MIVASYVWMFTVVETEGKSSGQNTNFYDIILCSKMIRF